MNEDAAAELHALRARAYGPDADILRDPAAYERLRELEEQLRSAQRSPEHSDALTDTPPAASGTEEATPSTGVSASASADAPDSAGAPAPSSGEPALESASRATWSPLTRVPPPARALWLVSVLTAATLAATVTWGLASIPVIAEGSGARQIAALVPDPSVTVPPFGDPSEQEPGFEFAGFTLARVSNLTYDTVQKCLIVIQTELVDVDAGSIGGPTYYGCGGGDFPPIVAVPLGSDAPAEALERFGEGSALQFVLQGDRVGVFVDPAPQNPVN